jgi:hypothetical protein
MQGATSGSLPGSARKSLKNKARIQVRNWASQRFARPERDLAYEFTRYAHRYPQDLWKSVGQPEASIPGKP